MTWYVGLTDDPDRRRSEHGAPSDWQQTTRAFDSEASARAWEEELHAEGRVSRRRRRSRVAVRLLVHNYCTN